MGHSIFNLQNLTILALLSCGSGFASNCDGFKCDNDQEGHSVAITMPAFSNSISPSYIENVSKQGLIRMIQSLKNIKQEEREKYVDLVRGNSFCKDLIEMNQETLSYLLKDLVHEDISDDGRETILTTLDFLYKKNLINKTDDFKVIKEMLSVFCCFCEDKEMQEKIVLAMDSPFFKGAIGTKKYLVLRGLFGYDPDSVEPSLCPRKEYSVKAKYRITFSAAMDQSIAVSTRYLAHYFSSYKYDVDGAIEALSKYSQYLERMIDPDSDIGTRIELLNDISSSSKEELDSIMKTINHLLQRFVVSV